MHLIFPYLELVISVLLEFELIYLKENTIYPESNPETNKRHRFSSFFFLSFSLKRCRFSLVKAKPRQPQIAFSSSLSHSHSPSIFL